MPVIASAVGGIPELIDDGVDGVLVPPASPDALAAAITALLDNGERAAALAVRGRERAERDHRLAVQVPALLKFYREIVRQSPVPV